MSRRRRALTAAVVVLVLTAALSGDVRRVLENLYVGAPFAWLMNAVRAHGTPRNGDDCLPALAASGRPFTRLDDADFPPDCPVRHAVALDWPLRARRFMTCGLATAVHAYYADGLQPLARRILGTGVTRIGDLGVRNCRPMQGHRFLLSEHAFADAIDLSAFELDDGTSITVADAWGGRDPHAWFVHEAARRACDFFAMVITPDHDAEHHDHIHADAGIFSGCLLDEAALADLRARFETSGP